MKIVQNNQSIWYEKYKPQTVQDLILPDPIKNKLLKYVETHRLPSLGFFAQNPGVGKSSSANSIIKDIGGEALWINASMERSIDVLRGRIQKFASQSSFDDKPKIVVMDECLEENEKVRIGTLDNWKGVKLNELERGKIYDCVSFNMETGEYENDTCEIISDKEDEIYEVELEDGRTVKVTGNHPFIVEVNGEFFEKSIDDGLNENDNIITPEGSKNPTLIKELQKSRVINLTVHRNHTFITENGIVTHNCDHFSKDGQAAFRGFIDEYSSNCGFIFTGNYKEKMIEPLLDRLELYDFDSFKKEEMVKPIFDRLCFILENEGVEYNKRDLVPVINTYYPRIRSMIGALQKFSNDGILVVKESELDDLNVFDRVLELTNPSTYLEMIQEVNALNAPDNMYSFLYKNSDKYFKQESYPNVVITVAKYQHMSDSVRDKNLNLAACLTELMKYK